MAAGSGHYWDYWYETVAQPPFRQGDILRSVVAFWLDSDVPIPSAAALGGAVATNYRRGDWILLDASCDLDQRVVPQALLAPVEPATHQTLKAPDDKQFKQRLEVMRKGGYVTRFLLSDHPELTPPFQLSFVDIRHHVVMPLESLEAQVVSPIIRLRSPIREQFGNWVGACFSRVGPENVALIPPFTASLHDEQRLRAATLEADGVTPSPVGSEQGKQNRLIRFVKRHLGLS